MTQCCGVAEETPDMSMQCAAMQWLWMMRVTRLLMWPLQDTASWSNICWHVDKSVSVDVRDMFCCEHTDVNKPGTWQPWILPRACRPARERQDGEIAGDKAPLSLCWMSF